MVNRGISNIGILHALVPNVTQMNKVDLNLNGINILYKFKSIVNGIAISRHTMACKGIKTYYTVCLIIDS